MPAFVAPAVAATIASSATPAGTAAIAPTAASFIQPWMQDLLPTAINTGVRAIKNFIAPDRQMQIFTDVLAAQTEFRNTLARRAIGKLTPREVEEIQAQGENQVNAVAANVASRGLGSSPAGAEIIADAQGQVFSQARQEAAAALPTYDTLISQSARQLMASDNSFNEDLTAIVRMLTAELDEDPEARNDPELIASVQAIWEALGSPLVQQ